jgi:hypothetical protein
MKLGSRATIWTTWAILQARGLEEMGTFRGEKRACPCVHVTFVFAAVFVWSTTDRTFSNHLSRLSTHNSTQVLSLAYVLLAIVAIKNVAWLQALTPRPADLPSGRILNAAMAALVISIIALVAAFAWSLLVLLRSTTARARITGFAKGSLLAMLLHTAFLMVLVGCVLNAYAAALQSLEASTAWSHTDTGAYTAAFVLAFIVGGVAFILFCLLAAFSHAFVKAPDAATA